MVKWWHWCNGDLLKCQNIIVLFSYLRVLIFLSFIATLTESGGGCTRQFLLHTCPYHPLHLHIRLPLPLPRNLSPHHSLLSLPIPLPRHLLPPLAPLYIYLPLPLTHNICPPRAHLSINLALPFNIHPPCAPLPISLPIHISNPPWLSQRFPCCHSYPNMIQIAQCI